MDQGTTAPRALNDLKRDPNVLRIIRWLLEDKSRTLPMPDDEDAIGELVRATGISLEFTRALMARVYGDLPGGDTVRLLT